MSRIAAINPATAEGKAKDLLAAVNQLLGVVPNLFRVTAQSPAALEGLLGLNGALSQGALSGQLRESIALAVAEANSCDYCLSAHTYLGAGAGLSEADVLKAREGLAADAKTSAVLRFSRTLVQNAGRVGDSDVAQLRAAGVNDAEIIEIVGNVVVNIFTNYLNHVAGTEIDFPIVQAFKKA